MMLWLCWLLIEKRGKHMESNEIFQLKRSQEYFCISLKSSTKIIPRYAMKKVFASKTFFCNNSSCLYISGLDGIETAFHLRLNVWLVERRKPQKREAPEHRFDTFPARLLHPARFFLLQLFNSCFVIPYCI